MKVDVIFAENKCTFPVNIADAGYDAGYNKAESDFWDALQDFGSRTNYNGYFRVKSWTDETFRPKYDMRVTDGGAMFYGTGIQDLKAILTRQGVTLDFTQDTSGWAVFATASLTTAPVISFATCKYYNQTFYQCRQLHTIEAIVSEADYRWGDTFQGCVTLENLTIEGTIGQNRFNVKESTKLTHDSLMSIINALQDTPSISSPVVTLGATNLAKLTDAEKAIATEKGWTLA